MQVRLFGGTNPFFLHVNKGLSNKDGKQKHKKRKVDTHIQYTKEPRHTNAH